MVVISIANQKGGVGKTTTSQHIAEGLTLVGYKVLLIDLDPQSNLTSVMGLNNVKTGIYNVLKNEMKIDKVITKINDNLDIVCSNILVANLEKEIDETGKEFRLLEALEEIKNYYHFCIIDCPPALGLLTTNAFTTSNYVIIPSQASKFALEGIAQMSSTIRTVKKYTNRDLNVLGILLTQFNSRANISKELLEITKDLSTTLDTTVFNTTISSSVNVIEAQALNTTIFTHNSSTKVATEYIELIKEVLERIKSYE